MLSRCHLWPRISKSSSAMQDLAQQSVVHITLPGYCFLHDMSLTESKYIAFCNPVRLRMLPLLLGLRCPIHCIRWTEGPTRIVLLDRPVSAATSLSAAHQISALASEAAAGKAGVPPSGLQQEGCGGGKGQRRRLRSRRGTMDSAQDFGVLGESNKGSYYHLSVLSTPLPVASDHMTAKAPFLRPCILGRPGVGPLTTLSTGFHIPNRCRHRKLQGSDLSLVAG